jgi:hypothetical protein
VSLAVKSTWCLPVIVLEREHDGLASNSLHYALDGSGLLGSTWAGLSVARTFRWPSGLQVETALAWAKTIDNVKLALGEVAGFAGINIGVEEGVDVATDNVNNTAKGAGILLPGAQGLGSGAWAGVSSAGESGLAGGDEASEFTSGSGTRGNGLVTDDNELDEIPSSPAGDVSDLLLSTRDTGAADENANDHLKARDCACISDVLKTRAVSAVDTDNLEAAKSDQGDISEDVSGTLALSVLLVWSVSHGPLVARGSERAA